MDRVPVISSNVASIGYDQNALLLEVQFKNGAIYHYFGVPGNLHNALMRAESKGSYLHQFIIGRFQYQRVM